LVFTCRFFSFFWIFSMYFLCFGCESFFFTQSSCSPTPVCVSARTAAQVTRIG
jgi:hypothetical protein